MSYKPVKNVIMTTMPPQRTVYTISETSHGIEPVFQTEPYVRRIRFSDNEDAEKSIKALKILFAEMSKAIDPSIKIRPADVVYESTVDTFMCAYRKPVPVCLGRFVGPIMLGEFDDSMGPPQQAPAPAKKCECGVDSVGGGIHSSWCPKA